MKEIFLNCVLMDNNEIMFMGRSLGFISKDDIDKHTMTRVQIDTSDFERFFGMKKSSE